MKESDVVIPEETTEVKLAMRIAELEAENKYLKLEAKTMRIAELEAVNRYLKLEAKEDEELIDGLEAERDRLREALEEQAEPYPASSVEDMANEAIARQRKAQKALEEQT